MANKKVEKFKKVFLIATVEFQYRKLCVNQLLVALFTVEINRVKLRFFLIQDAKNRWTIPKGHIEPGETAQQTAKREIGEEAGLKDVKVIGWLGKINFRYRRIDKLVLMTTQVYLVKALGDTNAIQKEEWMNDIRWFSFIDALDAIEYEDIEKLILLAMKKIRQEKL